MLYRYIDELHVEDVNQVGLAFAYFYLFDEGFQKDLYWDCLILLENCLEVSEHELTHGQLFVIFDE